MVLTLIVERNRLHPKPLQTLLTLDNAKTYVFFYIIIKYTLKTYRHVLARGLFGSVAEQWRNLKRVQCSTHVRVSGEY